MFVYFLLIHSSLFVRKIRNVSRTEKNYRRVLRAGLCHRNGDVLHIMDEQGDTWSLCSGRTEPLLDAVLPSSDAFRLARSSQQFFPDLHGY